VETFGTAPKQNIWVICFRLSNIRIIGYWYQPKMFMSVHL